LLNAGTAPANFGKGLGVRIPPGALTTHIGNYSDGRGPSSEGEVQFTELITSALSILDEELGKPNHYSVEIGRALSEG
jgi:hypothetical protein